MHQFLADSTFRVETGNSSGSGFSYRRNDIVVTNHHVIEPHLTLGTQIYVITESGTKLPANLLSHSPKTQYDFAILQLQQSLPAERKLLIPDLSCNLTRGSEILFAGFPHGIHDLLVHSAIISAPANNLGFYIDGSVNGGNSGGPIIDKNSGQVIGIVTQRRFLAGNALQQLGTKVSGLAAQSAGIANRGSVQIMGIDFGGFANIVAEGLSALSQVIELNSNVGIGIGFKIDFVEQEYIKLGL